MCLNFVRSSNLLVNFILILFAVAIDIMLFSVYSTRSIAISSSILGWRHLVPFLFQQYSKTIHQVILLLDCQICFPDRGKSPIFLLQEI